MTPRKDKPKKGSEKRPTSKDVAALANVAQSTVSYVMSGQRGVSKATERRVRAAMRELGYQPNAGARTLRTNKTNVVALALRLDEHVNAAETAPYIREIINEARKHDYDVILSTLASDAEDLVRLASRAICDGIIMMDIAIDDPRIHSAKELPVPTVLMGRPNDSEGLDTIDFNSREAAVALVDELHAAGHKSAVIIGEDRHRPSGFRFILDFYDGARERAEELGISLVVADRPNSNWDGFTQVLNRLLAKAKEPLAIITRTPGLTDWLMQYLESIEVVPGRDITVVAYCPHELAVSYPIPVTSVAGSIPELCQQAVRMVLDRVADPSLPVRNVLVETGPVIRRETTRLINC